ncbi:MAG: inositol monophosphatase [Planctomycetota bacterium]
MSRARLRLALRRAANGAAALLRSCFRTRFRVEEKAAGNLVSVIDRRAEATIRERLLGAFPRAGFLGEESGWTHGEDPIFVVDPLDGTTNYVRGLPYYAVSLAALERGEPVAGIIVAPELDLAYEATVGEGATLNGLPIHTRRARLKPASLIAVSSSFGPHLRRQCQWLLRGEKGKIRRLGSTALELGLLAEGLLDLGLFDRTHLWDVTAGWLLVSEAGGRCGLLNGSRLFPLPRNRLEEAGRFLAAWASNGLSHRDLATLGHRRRRGRGQRLG